MTPQRQIRENSGTVREAKGHSHGKAVTPRSNSKTLSRDKGPHPGGHWSGGKWRRPTAPEAQKTPREPEAEGRGPLWSPPQRPPAVSGCGSLLTSSRKPERLSSAKAVTTRDQLPWGSARPASDCGGLPQANATEALPTRPSGVCGNPRSSQHN